MAGEVGAIGGNGAALESSGAPAPNLFVDGLPDNIDLPVCLSRSVLFIMSDIEL
jgi:hypothetical protein